VAFVEILRVRTMSMAANGLCRGPRGWWLAPEGAVVHRAGRVAVIADVHLGYEWARAAGGDVVPAHSLRETLARLASLLGRCPITRLIVAGDLVEPFGPCARTERDLQLLRTWLDGRNVALMPLKGDHDRGREWPETVEVAGWTIAHGSRPIIAERLVGGHVHPVLKAEGRTFPCFLVGTTRMILPAFSANAAGLEVSPGETTSSVVPRDLRCLASTGTDWLDFGTIGPR
jgi:putative SbcD/Mre11-related phosphoesterase